MTHGQWKPAGSRLVAGKRPLSVAALLIVGLLTSSARAAGVADYVLPPQDMPGALLEHVSRAGIPSALAGR